MGNGNGVSATRYLHARVCESSTPPQNILPPTRTHTAGSSTERKLTKLFKTMIKKGGLITMFPMQTIGASWSVHDNWTGEVDRRRPLVPAQQGSAQTDRVVATHACKYKCAHMHTHAHALTLSGCTRAHTPALYRVLYDIVSPPTARARARVCEYLI